MKERGSCCCSPNGRTAIRAPLIGEGLTSGGHRVSYCPAHYRSRSSLTLLPAVVGECFVRLCHPVRVILFLDSTTLPAASREKLSSESL